MDRLTSFKDFLQNSVDADRLKQNKLVIASSLAALSLSALTYVYYSQISIKDPIDDDKISPTLSSKYPITQGQHYYEYPDTLRDDWYNSLKFLKAFPLSFTLPNNAVIYYNEFGDPNGFPIIHFHGSGGSNLEGIIYDKLGLKYNLRIIVMDRPGHGRSLLPPDYDTNIQSSYGFNEYFNDISIFLQNCLSIPLSNPIGISGASQGGVYAVTAVGILGKLGWNISFCLMMAGMPVSDIKKLLDENNITDNNVKEYNEIYTKAIPKGTLDNYKLLNMPWLYKMFGKGFTWYNKRQNFVINKTKLNYNWALNFLAQNDLLPPCDLEEIKRPVPGQVMKIENSDNNDDNKQEVEEVILDSNYFAKIIGEYSYRFQEQTGERWTVTAQCNLPDGLLEMVGKSLKEKKVLWYHGTEDRLIPLSWVKPFQKDLEKHGVEIVFEELENTGHFMFKFDNIEKGYKEVRKLLGDNGK